MDAVSKIVIQPLRESIYLKPYTMHFVQNGTKRTWDLLTVHDSVAIILYNISRNVLILVKQFRPAVYYGSIPEKDRIMGEELDTKKYPPELGITIELCAGIIDKNKSEAEIAKEEVLEECGYDVPVSSMEKIGSYRSGVGTSASLQTAFYCEVTDDMRVSSGGGVDDEIIEVVEMSVEEMKKYVTQNYIKSPPSFMFCMYWFLYNKQK
ncbi:uridine diphosphate glucose pyrophosphatase NUDT14-like [Diabrotica undecimpunctata]|uniref:uridine diphosphate glucose pyrophosphatase NUDT14-like n=1 Tax=Diabrotica undecimpunctata TaxID=50387 RepID=UPI003B63AA38